MTSLTIEIPDPIRARLGEAARTAGVSVEQFVARAVSAMPQQLDAFLAMEHDIAQVDVEAAQRFLDAVPDAPPLPGDELSPGHTQP